MAQRRKLQVFVSSTYTDMIEERQAAVEAVLQAGHIPAGMELFAGANEDQMYIIKRWIDDSDIFLLLLSGRYGSIELKSKKSYTHLEFEYAKKKKKKIIVAVASDSYLHKKEADVKGKNSVFEMDNLISYKNFKDNVTSKYARSWDSVDALKLLTINSIRALEDNTSLIGWIPGDQGTNSAEIANQLAILIKENKELRLLTQDKKDTGDLFNGLEFREVNRLLSSTPFDVALIEQSYRRDFMNCISSIDPHNSHPNLLSFTVLWYLTSPQGKVQVDHNHKLYKLIEILLEVGLFEKLSYNLRGNTRPLDKYRLSDLGKRYALKFRTQLKADTVDKIKDTLKDRMTDIFIV
ncbi:hypothetical protein GCM10028818_01210 [Spirosoma horti]